MSFRASGLEPTTAHESADGGCVGKSSLRRTGQCVVKKSTMQTRVGSHASAPLTNWWGPRIHYLRDRRMAWCVASCMDEARYPFHPYLRPPPGDVSWTPAGIVSSARVYVRHSTAPGRRTDFFFPRACMHEMLDGDAVTSITPQPTLVDNNCLGRNNDRFVSPSCAREVMAKLTRRRAIYAHASAGDARASEHPTQVVGWEARLRENST